PNRRFSVSVRSGSRTTSRPGEVSPGGNGLVGSRGCAVPDGSGHASAERDLPGLLSRNAEPKRRRKPRSQSFPGSLIVGLIGLIAALAVPFAPVIANDVTVTWPQAGSPPESTTAFFVPYEPEAVHIE